MLGALSEPTMASPQRLRRRRRLVYVLKWVDKGFVTLLNLAS